MVQEHSEGVLAPHAHAALGTGRTLRPQTWNLASACLATAPGRLCMAGWGGPDQAGARGLDKLPTALSLCVLVCGMGVKTLFLGDAYTCCPWARTHPSGHGTPSK